jgi:hypothetical protein
MKLKARGIVWVIGLAVAMAGCDGDKEAPATSQTTAVETEVAAEAPAPETTPAVPIEVPSAAAEAPVIDEPAAVAEVQKAEVSAAASGMLTIRFETSAPVGGKYANKNVHVVWVEKADGTFVRTLNLWGDKHAKELSQWFAKTTDRARDIQARTGATLTAYGTYTSTWDGKDAAGAVAADGEYVIRLELTNDNANKNKHNRAAMTFTKGTAAQTKGPVEENGYKQMTLTWEPE